MHALLVILLLGASAAAADGSGKAKTSSRSAAAAMAAKPADAGPAPSAVKMPPPKGSHVKADDNYCFQCHTNVGQWDEKKPDSWRLYIPENSLKDDVHWQKGVSCHDCHGGNCDTDKVNVAHAKEDGFRSKPEEIRAYCGYCHKDEIVELRKGVHEKAGPKGEDGLGTLLPCEKCHGTVAHHLYPAHDKRSPVFLDNQIQTCGGCHEEHLSTYVGSAHGQGLYKMGLSVTAACANCHGSHGIYRPADKRSSLHTEHVAQTCGKCHRFLEERLQKSVHGRHGIGGLADRVAPGGKEKRAPSCTSCHQGHDFINPESTAFRQQSPHRCGNCHSSLSQYYTMSMHGQLTELGYGPAAKCSDCHGAHDILPDSDPTSHLSMANRPETCRKCHPFASASFVSFDPHADYTNAQRDPGLYWTHRVLMIFIVTTFCAFGAHCLIWVIRSVVEVVKRGRPRGLVPGGVAYVRFSPFHRWAHFLLLVSFLGLAATGLPLKYSEFDWAKTLARVLGGFESTGTWHRFFAVITFCCFSGYVALLVNRYRSGRSRGTSRRELLFGPDSPLPNVRDLKDLLKMFRWFVGLGPRPTFERWAYWEKFDFWGACSDVILIGTTGLILWFPNLFCTILPGSALNYAKVIHSTLALLATGFVFAIHFITTHFRADKFPADVSVFTGLVSEEEFKYERPELFERLSREGELKNLRTTAPSRRRLWLITIGGLMAYFAGLALLAAMVIAALGG